MASRSPSDIDATYDVEDLVPGEDITLTVPNLILDNQEWIVDRAAMVYCDVFYPIEIDATGWNNVRSPLTIFSIDRCGDTGVSDTDSAITYVLAWSEDGSTDFDVRLQEVSGIGSGTDSVSVTASHTSKIWRAMSGNLELPNDIPQTSTMQLQAGRTAGSGKVWVGGLVVFVA